MEPSTTKYKYKVGDLVQFRSCHGSCSKLTSDMIGNVQGKFYKVIEVLENTEAVSGVSVILDDSSLKGRMLCSLWVTPSKNTFVQEIINDL